MPKILLQINTVINSGSTGRGKPMCIQNCFDLYRSMAFCVDGFLVKESHLQAKPVAFATPACLLYVLVQQAALFIAEFRNVLPKTI